MSRSSYVGQQSRTASIVESAGFVPSGPRLLAVAAGVVLLGSYLSVFYHVVDVVGGVRPFALAVGIALVLATAFARLGSLRAGLVLGFVLSLAGVAAYVLFVPSVFAELLTVEFARRWLSYLSGVSVLEFQQVDLWAITVAPGPAFLSWLLLLSGRYDASAIVGGLLLGFFALTGDAGSTTTLVGTTSLLATLGFGTVERESGTIRELLQLGFLLALAVVVARSIRVVPEGSGQSVAGSGGSGGSGEGPPLSGDLQNAAEEAHIHESISLSPTVLFTIAADAESEWRVAAYDRYTGSDWVRTGGTTAYEGPLSSPPGPTTRVEQTVRAERAVRTLPAAWKPIEVLDLAPGDVRVTDQDGLAPAGSLEPGQSYTVRSAIPDVTAGTLREAGEDYPEAIGERYLQLPESTPEQVGDLAEEVAGDAANPYDAAINLRRWLSSQKTYDLTVDRPPGDVVDAFLFGMDRGYCVYFASAMAVLLRSLRIPARFVLGYTSGQSAGEDRWVVRGLDSHAWVEAYFPGHGWVSFDPTPAVPRLDTRIRALESAREDGTDGVDTDESRDVSATSLDTEVDSVDSAISPTPDPTATGNASQRTTSTADPNGSSVAGQLQNDDTTGASAASADDDALSWLRDRDRIAVLAGAAGASIGLHWIGAFDRALRAGKLRWQRPTGSPRRDVERAFERFELLLSRRYRPRSPGETRRRYVAETVGLSETGRARILLDIYERASYGDGVTRAEADEAIQIVDGFVGADK